MTSPSFSFEVRPRLPEVGGGWRLLLLEDAEEVGGGVFEPGEDAYCDALAEGEEWLATRGDHGAL